MYAEKSAGIFREKYISLVLAAAGVSLTCLHTPSILDSQFNYWFVSYQTFSEILRISKKDWQISFSNFSFFWISSPPGINAKGVNDWQLIPQFSENVLQWHKLVSKKLAIQLKFIGELRIQLSILLRNSTNLRVSLVWNAPKLKGIVQLKLRWFEIDIKRQVLLQCWGVGHSFLILKGHHLEFFKKTFCRHLSTNYW
jgi:hypothetical protein